MCACGGQRDSVGAPVLCCLLGVGSGDWQAFVIIDSTHVAILLAQKGFYCCFKMRPNLSCRYFLAARFGAMVRKSPMKDSPHMVPSGVLWALFCFISQSLICLEFTSCAV